MAEFTKENYPIEKVKSFSDPDRCQALMHQESEQCMNKAVPGGTFCLVHGGNKQLESQKGQGLRNYRLGKFQAKLERHASSNFIKDLRDEIAVLRMILEERINFCTTQVDLLTQSGDIGDLVIKIEKVVTSCHKLESNMGQHLDKAALIQFAAQVVETIAEEIQDQETLDKISFGIIRLLKDDPN